MTRTLLIRNAAVLVTMDADRREIAGGAVLVEGNRIAAVGRAADLPASADTVIDAAGHIVLPGLVNTHHHMYQSLTRVVPGAQDVELFAWLKRLYPIWAGLTPEMIRVSTQTAMAELILSGCTTTADHLYIYPNGCRLDDAIEAAEAIGMRFHAARGSMSLGESHGGLPPDSVVEEEAAILRDTRRLIETYHDPAPLSMRRIVVAPCSPFSVSRDLMRNRPRWRAPMASRCTLTLPKVRPISPTAARSSAGPRPNMPRMSAGSAPTSGTPIACDWTIPASGFSPVPEPGLPIVPVRTCGSPPE